MTNYRRTKKAFRLYTRSGERVSLISEHDTEREGKAALQAHADILGACLSEEHRLSGRAEEWAFRVYRVGQIAPVDVIYMVETWEKA